MMNWILYKNTFVLCYKGENGKFVRWQKYWHLNKGILIKLNTKKQLESAALQDFKIFLSHEGI